MVQPVRLQLSRAKGFNLQEHSRSVNGLDAFVVRRPTKWGNPFTIEGCREAGFVGDGLAIAKRVTGAYSAWIDSKYWRENWNGEDSKKARDWCLENMAKLRGKNLACTCDLYTPCHADILLEIANRPICESVK